LLRLRKLIDQETALFAVSFARRYPVSGQIAGLDWFYNLHGPFIMTGIVQSPAIGLIMSQLILDGESTYDVKSIEADRYFDMPAYLERGDIEAMCVSMAGNYYGKIERPTPVAGAH
jgi:glycine/D-amino acid oxidase-like deaminating enzyme